jgi:hypothetical protein
MAANPCKTTARTFSASFELNNIVNIKVQNYKTIENIFSQFYNVPNYYDILYLQFLGNCRQQWQHWRVSDRQSCTHSLHSVMGCTVAPWHSPCTVTDRTGRSSCWTNRGGVTSAVAAEQQRPYRRRASESGPAQANPARAHWRLLSGPSRLCRRSTGTCCSLSLSCTAVPVTVPLDWHPRNGCSGSLAQFHKHSSDQVRLAGAVTPQH